MVIDGVVYHVETYHDDQEKALVFLHGFTGSTRTWHPLISRFPNCRVVLVDLLGHGKTESLADVERYSMDRQVADLHQLFQRLGLEQPVLVGYSMGGRTALAYACTYPDSISRLVLESASPGLISDEEQAERRLQDSRLAERIMDEGIYSFVGFWEQIPMFRTQKELPAAVRRAVREERLSQDPKGLAGSLVGMGTGAQASYWSCLERLSFPVLLLTGIKDEKFSGIAKRMMQCLKSGRHVELDAGHALHVEKPAEFATIIKKQLNL
ncbi:2-succinyl-6-hydroxy-2,4-cyclohexadiene-1-carboxylate synthase [Indiicoccus explosivorum]|uniref:2-succinyl-6-hydroxy-2, 4-cyclohexadiene-1-carboxylate synthase n=1 Tax=Indiicoccus explosivorum TaxID=1917864 RepID=UPI000B44A455|nr:2-succinyl-6-hydroxy-2,4-cyclohexadiene-1-carboxylate synthase [Indiicoccus explosivorum]